MTYQRTFSTISLVCALLVGVGVVFVRCSSPPLLDGLASFPGNSSLLLKGGATDIRSQLTFSFRSCEYGYLLEQLAGQDSLQLQLMVNGSLQLSILHGGSYREVFTVGTGLNDNRWHVVTMKYTRQRLQLLVDSRVVKMVASEQVRTAVLGVQLAGGDQMVGRTFRGCLLRGPGVRLDRKDAVLRNVKIGVCHLPDSESCQGYNDGFPSPCFNEPCKHGGNCSVSEDSLSFKCHCSPRFSGNTCEIDLGELCSRPEYQCQNGGRCLEDSEGWTSVCQCPPGFTGDRCQVPGKECSFNSCNNEGRCLIVDQRTVCSCPPGFTGHNCETQIQCSSRTPRCRHEGTCISKYGGHLCDCRGTGYRGEWCEENIDECRSDPCQNNGTCYDMFNFYICSCPSGWQGEFCEQDVDECLDRPCLNNGKCTNVPGSYQCVCRSGFGGDQCQINVDEACAIYNCTKPSICNLTDRGPECVCPPGLIGEDCSETINTLVAEAFKSGGSTDMIDDLAAASLSAQLRRFGPGCADSPCRNGGTCTELSSAGDYRCRCVSGFVGATCSQRDPCQLAGFCKNNGTCVATANGTASCQCASGYSGNRCETLVRSCKTKPCQNNGVCVETGIGSDFYCECQRGFEGLTCQSNVDECRGVVCPEGRVCHDLIATYECRCPTGTTGPSCSERVSPCVSDPCSDGATCVVVNNATRTCKCPPGYRGDDCSVDIDECTEQKPCMNGICTNLNGSYQCYCRPGYLGDHCDIDYDECLAKPCRNNATCVNLENDYRCDCAPGYTGRKCEIDINECEPNQCQNNATCHDMVAHFHCECQPGFDGKLCQTNIDECAEVPCKNNGTCKDGINAFSCNCDETGFRGETCEENINDCLSNECQHGSTCVDLIKDYRCDCHSGFEGKYCEHDIAECQQNPCQNNATCLERSNRTLYSSSASISGLPSEYNHATAGGYICQCLAGFTGENCQINIDDCVGSPCNNGRCVDGVDSFKCVCDAGYEGERCAEEIDECKRYKPCAHGLCHDLVADYNCMCADGFGGKNCSVELLGCRGITCLNDGLCRPYVINETDHRYQCECRHGFTGELCGDKTTLSFDGSGYLRQDMVSTSQTQHSLSLRFRTTLADGLLAMAESTQTTFYVVRLISGRVNVLFNLQSTLDGVFVGGTVNNAEWHNVSLALNRSQVFVSVDGVRSSVALRVSSAEQLRFSLLSLGKETSLNVPSAVNSPAFVGCMQDVQVAGNVLVPARLNKTELYQVEEGCPRKDQCLPTPCQNKGRCIDLWNQYRCQCSRPYIGKNCQQSFAAATFNHENSEGSEASSSIDASFAKTLQSYIDVSLFVRTRQANGMIFYIGSKIARASDMEAPRVSYIMAELLEHILRVRVKLTEAGKEQVVIVTEPTIDDGENNLIRVLFNGSSIGVWINGVSVANSAIQAEIPLEAKVMFLGDIAHQQNRTKRQADDSTLTPFKGSLQDIRIVNAEGETRLVQLFPVNDTSLNIARELGQVSKKAVLEGSISDDVCKLAPCKNNGSCEVTWNDFECVCARGYRGRTCHLLQYCEWHQCPSGFKCGDLSDGHECIGNATFNGVNTSVEYRAAGKGSGTWERLQSSIMMRFRSVRSGVLLSLAVGEVQQLEIAVVSQHGEEERKESNGTGVIVVQWSKTVMLKLADGYPLLSGDWHSLQMNFNSTHMHAIIDGKENIIQSMPSPLNLQQLIGTGGYVVLGARPQVTNHLPQSVSDNFRGCMSEVRMGGVLLPFISDRQLNSSASHRFVANSGSLTNLATNCTLCYEHECANGGRCAAPSSAFECTCKNGFNGSRCEHNIDECSLGHKCENGAVCVDGIANYTCDCIAGYTGRYCELDIDECATKPCQNGATCLDGINNFTCLCTDEYSGKLCEKLRIINCTHTPCEHSGVCTNVYRGGSVAVDYSCSCPLGYEGRRCEKITDFCKDSPCLNNGNCTSIEAVGFECACLDGFAGKHCEVNIDECGARPCQNGGKCVDLINNFTCECKPGWQGRTCEIDIAECDLNPCENGGNCTELLGSFQCSCPETHCGLRCSLTNHCIGQEWLCQNEGQCVPQCEGDENLYGPQNVSCSCTGGYFGAKCENWSRASEIVMIVVPLLCILLLAAVVGLVTFTMMVKQKRATRGTYSPSRQEMFNPRVELGNMKKPPPEERLI